TRSPLEPSPTSANTSDARWRSPPSAVPEGGERHLASDVFAEVGDGSSGDLVCVLLEAEGRIEKDGVEPRLAHARDQVLVDRRHHRAGLAGTENGDQPCRSEERRVGKE